MPTNLTREQNTTRAALLTKIVVIAGSGVLAVCVGVNAAHAIDLQNRCTVALSTSGTATAAATASQIESTAALKNVTGSLLPAATAGEKSGGNRADFAARPAAATRLSGAQLMINVSVAELVLSQKTDSARTTCKNSRQIAAIARNTVQVNDATKTLNSTVAAITADFTTFQIDEAARQH